MKGQGVTNAVGGADARYPEVDVVARIVIVVLRGGSAVVALLVHVMRPAEPVCMVVASRTPRHKA